MKIFRLLLPALLLTACSTHSAIERSQGYARRGDYLHAYQVLDAARNEQLEGGSVDPDLEEAYVSTKKEYLRDRARRLIFQEREDLALRDLAELAELDPNFPVPPRLDHDAFEIVVDEAVQLLPKDFQAPLETTEIVIEPVPAEWMIDRTDPAETPPDLLGLFVGASEKVSLTQCSMSVT